MSQTTPVKALAVSNSLSTHSAETLPVWPYSFMAMKAVIEECQVNQSAIYFNSDDDLPALELTLNSESRIVTNKTPLELQAYSPNQFSDYDMAGSDLICLFEHELRSQRFTVINRTTNIESDATFFAAGQFYFVGDTLTEFKSAVELERLYQIVPAAPQLEDLRAITGMDDDTFWKIVEKAEWTTDHDSDRIKEWLLNNFKREEHIAFEKEMKSKRNELDLAIGDRDLDLSDTSFRDCLNHIIGCGKDTFIASVGNIELIAERANNRDFVDSFSYSVPWIHQEEEYPYSTELCSDDYSEITNLATMSFALKALDKIDYNRIIPLHHEETKLKAAECTERLTNLINGRKAEAYAGFDKQAYSRLRNIKGTELHALVPNCILAAMKADGINYLTN